MKDTTDILISGAGPAGMIAAAAFAQRGLSVTLVDPKPPTTESADAGADRRSTAFLRNSIALFEQTGLWERLAPDACPLRALRIVDLAGEPPRLRDERAFTPDDLEEEEFGYNFLNWHLRAILLDHLQQAKGVTLRFGVRVTRLFTRIGAARIGLSDGQQITAQLALGADGAQSALRQAAGISATTTRYGQRSLAFTATHAVPHHEVSTELYHEGGPFTMVPLKAIDGQPASAIVWMNPAKVSADLEEMDQEKFEVEMMRRTAGLFGAMRLASPRASFPIISQRADVLTGQRVALMAEAAHVLPPIGAQGLNSSINDIHALLAALDATGEIGSEAMLTKYEKLREGDIKRRAALIDLFNRVTRSGLPALQGLRLTGLRAAHDIAPLRRGLMAAGLGPDL